MGMLIAPVEVRDLKVDYIYKLWGSLGCLAPQEWRGGSNLRPQPEGRSWQISLLPKKKKIPILEGCRVLATILPLWEYPPSETLPLPAGEP